MNKKGFCEPVFQKKCENMAFSFLVDSLLVLMNKSGLMYEPVFEKKCENVTFLPGLPLLILRNKGGFHV
jgi:hypothetical protein